MNKLHLISNVKVNQADLMMKHTMFEQFTRWALKIGLSKIICKEIRILCQKRMRILSI